MDETKKVGNLILTIIVLLALAFGIYYLVSRNNADTADQPVPGTDYYVSVVQVKHQFKDGKHTYAGTIDLPNACYSLGASINKESDEQGVLKFETSMNTEEMCAQVVTARSFREEVEAPAGFILTGVLNGRAVELNMYEVPADQDIDVFEINVKG